VQRDAGALLSGDFEESIGFIRNAVQHLSNIIDGLLRLSRVGRVVYDATPIDMNVVVAEMLSAMHNTITAAGARIDVDALPTVLGDRNAAGQVFANLIGNSLKSFDRSRPGRIHITATDEDIPVFAIKDNGVGIPLAYQPKVFQVFQHVHSRVPRGEGMGLAIVRRIVERHGGRIWFTSTPDQGTTFFFSIGRAVNRPARPSAEAHEQGV
jgi:signal transduction histidine kinase